MFSKRVQRTISRPCTVSGRGYWSGKLNSLTFLPAPSDHGVRFVRQDLPYATPVHAKATLSQGMPLRTRLTDGHSDFDMIEHVMSALYGLGIHNVLVQCTSAEMPGFDGSSFPIALALQGAGIQDQESYVQDCPLTEVIEVSNDDRFVRYEPQTEGNQLSLEYQLDYGESSPIGIATFACELSSEFYLEQIAPARTFVTREEADQLQANGIAQHVTERDLLVFGPDGPIGNELRFADECARHKALDLLGDLALTGVNLVGRLIARRSGHQMNGELARLIQEKMDEAANANIRVAS
ncbi:MAG: UDP-3-O-acyl-N-acetylglucosamine deacetylase [Planctomycetota bacterium]